MRADDALKYVAAILNERIEWTTDGIGGSGCDHSHDIELDALLDINTDVRGLAARFGDLNRYSDGRMVKTRKEIDQGLYTVHVWHPDPSSEESKSHRGALLSGDPDVPSPGIYEVTTYPETQEIHVRVVRSA